MIPYRFKAVKPGWGLPFRPFGTVGLIFLPAGRYTYCLKYRWAK